MITEALKKAKDIVQLFSEAKHDARQLSLHMKKVDNCRRLLKDSREERLTVGGFGKKTVKAESGFLVSNAVLYRMGVLVVLWKKATTVLSQDLLFSSQDVPKLVENPVAALHGPKKEKRV